MYWPSMSMGACGLQCHQGATLDEGETEGIKEEDGGRVVLLCLDSELEGGGGAGGTGNGRRCGCEQGRGKGSTGGGGRP
jgi:hypothetical protein